MYGGGKYGEGYFWAIHYLTAHNRELCMLVSIRYSMTHVHGELDQTFNQSVEYSGFQAWNVSGASPTLLSCKK